MSDETSTPKQKDRDPAPKRTKPPLSRTFKSVAAAFLGVQSHKNYTEDFETSSSPLRFIVVGLVLGLTFFGLLFLITWGITALII